MPEETSLTEHQSDEQDKGFWRQFWTATRPRLLTTILLTIIVIQWVSMMAIEHRHDTLRPKMEEIIALKEALRRDNSRLIEKNERLIEENRSLKKQLAQRK